MKMTSLALVFVLLVFPLSYMNSMDMQAQKLNFRTEQQYNRYLEAAIMDAAAALSFNWEHRFEARYESPRNFRANKEEAIEVFFHTLYINFGVENDPIGQKVLAAYIPVVIIMDYDGYWIYAVEEYVNATGAKESGHVWKAKRRYAYADMEGNSISFTLDDYVFAYDANLRQWMEGFRADVAEITSIPLLNIPREFDQVRQNTIVSQIEEDLAYFINHHNTYTRQYGISYTFTLPRISQEEWHNTIQDIGVLAFIQGIPIGNKYYNNYALGGGRLLKKPVIYGAMRDGIKIYFRSDCPFTDRIIETFAHEKQAAMNGYSPRSCLNPP